MFKTRFVELLSWAVSSFIFLIICAYPLLTLGLAAGLSMMMIALYQVHTAYWKRKGIAVQLTGLSGAGKSTIAQAVKKKLERKGFDVEIIDGDEYRKNLCSDLGFSKQDRIENIRRLAFVANKLSRKNIVLIAAINPYEASRAFIKEHNYRHLTVHVDAQLSTVVARDTKGLYRKAMLPPSNPQHIPNFTGISDPFEEPMNVDLVLDTDELSVKECTNKLTKCILKNV